jgi:hypothetical protein
LTTVALTGHNGGAIKELVDFCLCVPAAATPRIQEAHILVGHALCEIVEQELFPLTPQGYLSLPANQSSLRAAHISP